MAVLLSVNMSEKYSFKKISGMLLMVLATLMMTSMLICIRLVPGNLHPYQLAFFRNCLGLILLFTWQSRNGFAFLKTTKLPLHLARGTFNTMAMLAFFPAIFLTPIATLTALGFTAQLFASLLSILILKEQFRFRRLGVIVFGFIGALIILRPGIHPISLGPLLALFAAMMWAVNLFLMKLLSRTDSSVTIAIYMVVCTTPVTLLASVSVWQWPDLFQWPWLLLIACLGTIAQICLGQSFKLSEASAVMPLDFLQLIWGALMGFLVFGEIPDLWIWVGGAIIFSSTTFLIFRESESAEVHVS